MRIAADVIVETIKNAGFRRVDALPGDPLTAETNLVRRRFD